MAAAATTKNADDDEAAEAVGEDVAPTEEDLDMEDRLPSAATPRTPPATTKLAVVLET